MIKQTSIRITEGDIEVLENIYSIMVDHELDDYVDNRHEMESLKKIIVDFKISIKEGV